MIAFDCSLPTPAENLALDEALLEAAEAGTGGERLRFWESPQTFVVVGFSNRIALEVNVEACNRAGVAILRRVSGGGTVVQGPGCLNYTLVLECGRAGLQSIPSANRAIMETNRAALQALLPGRVLVQGHTDLTHDGKKFSGNAQRRSRGFLLFHGTILLQFDLSLIGSLLAMPSREPAYRQGRAHGEFVGNTGLSGDTVRAALACAWGTKVDAAPGMPDIRPLVANKYSQPAWNQKF